MSYDVALFFDAEEFPLGEWEALIAPFDAHDQGVQPSSRNVEREWVALCHDAALRLELRDVRGAHCFKPCPARWQIFASRVGHRPRAVWLQFAVAYHALALLENVTFYDLQQDRLIASADEFFNFAREELAQCGRGKMFALGLLDGDGEPIF